jgi:MYXO-CTERM domain-containing protein
MRTVLVGLIAAAGFAASANADLVQPATQRLFHTDAPMFVDGHGGGTTRVDTRVYDNWTAPPTALTGLFTTGGTEIADDLNMQPIGAGWLDNLGFAVANSNGAAGSSFTGGVVKISFYRQSNGSVILSNGGFTGFTANLPTLALAPGGSSRISFGPDALKSLGWFFDTANIFASLQIQSVTGTGGFTLANAGMQTRSGGTIGTSADNMFSFGPTPPTGNFNFGGNPVANSAWFIDVDNVPGPGSLSLLALGGLVAARRRRA